MQSIFTPATFANIQDASGLAGVMASYLEDVNIQEPKLLTLYDALLPQITMRSDPNTSHRNSSSRP